MKPLTILTELTAVDEKGDLWYLSGEDEYTKIEPFLVAPEIVEEFAAEVVKEHGDGWYQDDMGNLYQYSEGSWVSGSPDIDKLEYLG
jgi:hypothetical protein